MDPFNIVIRRDGKQLGLNIHPKDDTGFMVIFEGSLVGEVFLNSEGKVWQSVAASELLEGSFANYPCDESVDCEGLLLDESMVEQIGKQIAQTLGLREAP